MFDAQKLMQRLLKTRQLFLAKALDPVPEGRSVDYEFGRRVGYKQGVDDILRDVERFFKDDEYEEKDSKL